MGKSKQASPKRNYVFTWNNPQEYFTDGDYNKGLTDIFKSNEAFKRASWQLEQGESGTLHLQGYLELKPNYPKRITELKKLFPVDHIHFDDRKGSQQQAYDYTRKKDETYRDGPWEYGDWTIKQGTRSDLLRTKDAFDAKKKIIDIVNDESTFTGWIKHRQGWQDYKRINAPRKDWVTEFEIHVGEGGTGKTTITADMYPDAYEKAPGMWWDDYDGEEIAIMDEFQGNCYPLGQLNKIADPKPLKLQIKGGFVQGLLKKLVILSNKYPWDWYDYKELKVHPNTLYRRITTVYYHKKNVRTNGMSWNTFVEWYATYVDQTFPWQEHTAADTVADWRSMPIDEEMNKQAEEITKLQQARKLLQQGTKRDHQQTYKPPAASPVREQETNEWQPAPYDPCNWKKYKQQQEVNSNQRKYDVY